MYKELQTAGDEAAAENHRREMGKKLSEWFINFVGDSRTPGCQNVFIKKVGSKFGLDGKLLLLTLCEQGFIDFGIIIDEYVNGGGGKNFSQLLLNQNESANSGARNGFMLELQNAADEMSKATTLDKKTKAKAKVAEIRARWLATMPRVTWGATKKKESDGGH